MRGATAKSVELLELGSAPKRMPRDQDGWYQCLSSTVHVGTRYQFRINEDLIVPCDEATFAASKLDWDALEQASVSQEFRALTMELLTIRQQKIVPLIKDGFVKAQVELLGRKDRTGGLNPRWQTAAGDVLQIFTNFSTQVVPRPALIGGETLWGGASSGGYMYLHPAEIVARRGPRMGG
jgi:hypothetical protein